MSTKSNAYYYNEIFSTKHFSSRAAVTKYYRLDKTTELYSLAVLEIRRSKSKSWQDWFFLEGLRDSLFYVSLLAFGGCLQSLAFLYLSAVTF